MTKDFQFIILSSQRGLLHRIFWSSVYWMV